MNKTFRVCHLEYLPKWKEGDIITKGKLIGRMGNTGKSTASHFHADCVEEYQFNVYRLADMSSGRIKPDFKALLSFMNNDLLNTEIEFTSFIYDPRYKDKNGNIVYHPALDFVPKNRHTTKDNYDIVWNQEVDGLILRCEFDNGYGNHVNIGFKA